MLRTNQSFLAIIALLYESQNCKENIILKHYVKGTKLFSQNESTTKVMFINEGITKCFFSEENDKEFIIEFLGKGEILGEVECISNTSCLCNIEAITNVSVYSITKSYFQNNLMKDERLNELLLKSFAERIINTSKRASFQQSYTTNYSLNKLLEFKEKQEMELSKEDMARYLGISIRSLNRGLRNLSD